MAAGALAAPFIVPLQSQGLKNHIDTSTRVAIQSAADSPDVFVFYTLDGSKPVPLHRSPGGSSKKYRQPLLLPAGRVEVRALAATRDGRESATVTKVFNVDLVEWRSRTEEEEKLMPRRQSPLDGKSPSVVSPQRPTGPHFQKSRLDTPDATTKTDSQCSMGSQHSQWATKASSALTSLVQREASVLQCPQCLQPSLPLAQFCAQCGTAAPQTQRAPPAEGGQVTFCGFCNALVPVNTHTCLVCESSHIQLQDFKVCVCCGWGNPAHASNCLTCESHLLPAVCVVDSAPSVPAATSRMSSCSRCDRVNFSDARFCDWCGCKLKHPIIFVTCRRCGATGHPHAIHCAACGVLLEAPSHTTRSVLQHPLGAAMQQSPDRKFTAEQQTQTDVSWSPSAPRLPTTDRKPRLTAISPGRGFWRIQLDHVCSHLRSFAQNNESFRALIGEPQLGRVVSVAMAEDQYEVSLTISFVSANQVSPARRPDALSAVTEGTFHSSKGTSHRGIHDDSRSTDSALIGPVTGGDLGGGTRPAPRTDTRLRRNNQLLQELGPGAGRRQVDMVQQLLDQGADPCCQGADGVHALALAAANGYHDVLPVLLQRGADVNQRSGRMKNTALHEAVACGSEGLKCAEVLLSCRASSRLRNAAGQTPFDVASSTGCDGMMLLLAERGAEPK